jgi:hypothetical protein
MTCIVELLRRAGALDRVVQQADEFAVWKRAQCGASFTSDCIAHPPAFSQHVCAKEALRLLVGADAWQGLQDDVIELVIHTRPCDETASVPAEAVPEAPPAEAVPEAPPAEAVPRVLFPSRNDAMLEAKAQHERFRQANFGLSSTTVPAWARHADDRSDAAAATGGVGQDTVAAAMRDMEGGAAASPPSLSQATTSYLLEAMTEAV